MPCEIDKIAPLDAEQIEDLERLAALGYSVKEMAMYFDLPLEDFTHDAKTEGCTINYHIQRGKMTIKANSGMKLMISAESGNLTAIQQLAKVQKERDYKDLLTQLYDD
ncbi:MAG TPA: hypothetical protein VK152_00335 [Paludibacter sp.]|nr:hypothetical protein [Paludibacter sp.]